MDPETGRILLIYPPVQNVFYQTKNFYTDSITEVMFNGCQVDGTELYSLNGFCKVLNSRDRQEAVRERSEA